MQGVYFKTNKSGPVCLLVEGRIDFSELGRKFGFDPISIVLNGTSIPKEGLQSKSSWEQIEELFKQYGIHDGTKEDPVMVTGEAAVHAVSTKGGSPSKRAPLKARDCWQTFVQSAAKHYKEWEEADDARAEVGIEQDCGMKLFTLSGDPVDGVWKERVIGIRECYKDLKKILVASEAGHWFVVLGTSNIGVSSFSAFWICYQAFMKKKVVWKLFRQFYLLDFSDEAAKAYGPFGESDPEIQEVFLDRAAWLILDGGQRGGFACECHILVPCSAQKQNYVEFSKGRNVSKLYLPVWEAEEISQFLDAFQEHRSKYPHMLVPSKEEAMKNFEELGGVARYVLCSHQTVDRKGDFLLALARLNAENCLQKLGSEFESHSEIRDLLVHITCGQNVDDKYGKYSTPDYKLATSRVKSQIKQLFDRLTKADVVNRLKLLTKPRGGGSQFAYVFELVGHVLFIRGGKFRMKKVLKDGRSEELSPLELPALTPLMFESLETLPKLKALHYYRPRAENLRSIDAILHPDHLLQFFSYSRGTHGYLVKGLEDVHAQLNLEKYKVCSCVPKENYDKIGFQPWLSTKGEKYKQPLPLFLEDSEQFVIEVDFEKY